MYLAFGVIVLGVGFSFLLALLGFPLYGSGFAFISILSAAGVFFRKRISKTDANRS
jgi:membrane protein implicated in regulation of membrane protease activity